MRLNVGFLSLLLRRCSEIQLNIFAAHYQTPMHLCFVGFTFNMLLGISKRISLTSQRYSGIAADTAKCSFVYQEERAWKWFIYLAETCCNGSWVVLFILQNCKLQLMLPAVQILYMTVLCVADQNIFFTFFTSNLKFSFLCNWQLVSWDQGW